MRNLCRNWRRTLSVPCCVMILLTCFHCLIAHGHELEATQHDIAWTTAALPSFLLGCENESGCLCRGATLIDPTHMTIDDGARWNDVKVSHDLLNVEWFCTSQSDDHSTMQFDAARYHHPLLLSALEMRAVLQSFRC